MEVSFLEMNRRAGMICLTYANSNAAAGRLTQIFEKAGEPAGRSAMYRTIQLVRCVEVALQALAQHLAAVCCASPCHTGNRSWALRKPRVLRKLNAVCQVLDELLGDAGLCLRQRDAEMEAGRLLAAVHAPALIEAR